MRQSGRQHRGVLLITSYMLLAVFIVYANMMALRAFTQRMANEGHRDLDQSLNLAQAAIEQLQEDLYQFLVRQVYSIRYQGDAGLAMQWLDSLNAVAIDTTGTTSEAGAFPLRLPRVDRNGDGVITWDDWNVEWDGQRNGFKSAPRCVTDLPTVMTVTVSGKTGVTTTPGRCQPAAGANSAAVEAPRAWIVSVGRDINGNGKMDPGEDQNGNSPLSRGANVIRYVTFEAEARAGAASVTKRLRATYEFTLGGTTSVFRYAYFRNNSATFAMPNASLLEMYGEVGTNGDMSFSGNAVRVFGDLYASDNPAALDLSSASPGTGDIIGSPSPYPSYMGELPEVSYWRRKPTWARPIRDIVLGANGSDPQPLITGTQRLPAGSAWDTAGGTQTDPRRFAHQEIQPMPYLGSLEYDTTLATQAQGTLTYYPVNLTTGAVATTPTTISAVLNNDATPLLLIGTAQYPIQINGPVVVTGDVIIRGVVTGRGTIYSGRNTHIAGQLIYKDAARYDPLERNISDPSLPVGTLTPRHGIDGPANPAPPSMVSYGVVCANGTYKPPGGSCP